MTEHEPRHVSPSSLGTYACCPRQYEFEKVWDVSSPEETRRYLDRGLALHETIEEVCEYVREEGSASLSDDDIRTVAIEQFETTWENRTSRKEYYSDAHYRFDGEQSRSAIEHYFGEDAPGIDHARNSVANELWVSFELDGVALHGRVDNVVRTAEGFLVIDYKSSFGGIVSSYSADAVEEHLAEDDHHPRRVKSMFQAATYLEGLKAHDVYEPGLDVEFTYYALLDDTAIDPGVDGVSVSVTGRSRDVTEIYVEYHDTVWELISHCHDGIVSERYEPEPWSLIQENACEDCSYRRMCPDYVAEEVRLVE